MDSWWIDATKRGDGLTINKMANDTWIIRPPRGLPVEVCPCCQRGFVTMYLARQVADIMFALGPFTAPEDDPEPQAA